MQKTKKEPFYLLYVFKKTTQQILKENQTGSKRKIVIYKSTSSYTKAEFSAQC